MKTNPFNSRLTFHRLTQYAALALLLSAAARLPAQDFSITGAYVRADGRIVLQYPADANAYYVLYHGPLTNLTQVMDVRLGINGTGELVWPCERSAAPGVSETFVAVCRSEKHEFSARH